MLGKLQGKEMSFVDLDKRMVENGFYSVLDDGITADIKNDLRVAYTSTATNEVEMIVSFNITIDNSDDEAQEAFMINVISVDRI